MNTASDPATSPRQQYTLSLPVRESMSGTDFLVTPSNDEAIKWIDDYPNWPHHALILHGDDGSGKTHLAHVWQERSLAQFVTPATLNNADLARETLANANAFVVDKAESFFDDAAREESLFHFFNNVRDQQRHMLIILRKPAAQCAIGLPDLASRLRACPTVGMLPPDDSLMAALLIKQFRDRQITVDKGVIDYILPRIERRADAVRDLVQKLDETALAEHRAITVPLVKRVLPA